MTAGPSQPLQVLQAIDWEAQARLGSCPCPCQCEWNMPWSGVMVVPSGLCINFTCVAGSVNCLQPGFDSTVAATISFNSCLQLLSTTRGFNSCLQILASTLVCE